MLANCDLKLQFKYQQINHKTILMLTLMLLMHSNYNNIMVIVRNNVNFDVFGVNGNCQNICIVTWWAYIYDNVAMQFDLLVPIAHVGGVP